MGARGIAVFQKRRARSMSDCKKQHTAVSIAEGARPAICQTITRGLIRIDAPPSSSGLGADFQAALLRTW